MSLLQSTLRRDSTGARTVTVVAKIIRFDALPTDPIEKQSMLVRDLASKKEIRVYLENKNDGKVDTRLSIAEMSMDPDRGASLGAILRLDRCTLKGEVAVAGYIQRLTPGQNSSEEHTYRVGVMRVNKPYLVDGAIPKLKSSIEMLKTAPVEVTGSKDLIEASFRAAKVVMETDRVGDPLILLRDAPNSPMYRIYLNRVQEGANWRDPNEQEVLAQLQESESLQKIGAALDKQRRASKVSVIGAASYKVLDATANNASFKFVQENIFGGEFHVFDSTSQKNEVKHQQGFRTGVIGLKRVGHDTDLWCVTSVGQYGNDPLTLNAMSGSEAIRKSLGRSQTPESVNKDSVKRREVEVPESERTPVQTHVQGRTLDDEWEELLAKAPSEERVHLTANTDMAN